MFLQVIQGRTSDAKALRQRFDDWAEALAPGAKGYLGTTAGVAEDGTAIILARFESEEAAQANSSRPEQGAWWSETAKVFDGDVTFRDCADVETMLGGGSDEAGFVQIIQGRSPNRKRLAELEKQFESTMSESRPDVLGSVRGWDGESFTEAVYFSSEAEARKGEAAMAESGGDGGSPEAEEFGSLMEDVTYIDLKDPWLRSA